VDLAGAAVAGAAENEGGMERGRMHFRELRTEEKEMTTIAIPIRDGRFCEHFGGADAFALYSIADGAKSVDTRQMMSPPEHGRGVFPVWLRQVGAEVILAGGMGPRAVGIFAQHGIEVVLGVRGEDPDLMVERYLAGTLEATGEPCHDQGFHDCSHHEPRGGGGCGGDHTDH
jgi:ATP-binding protein involved in chromosome partitioning